MKKIDAEDELNRTINRFWKDLGFTAPELHQMRIEELRGNLQRLLNEIFEDLPNA